MESVGRDHALEAVFLAVGHLIGDVVFETRWIPGGVIWGTIPARHRGRAKVLGTRDYNPLEAGRRLQAQRVSRVLALTEGVNGMGTSSASTGWPAASANSSGRCALNFCPKLPTGRPCLFRLPSKGT